MLWIKAFHIIFMVTWFAGLFYLPRLFVYHAMSDDEPSVRRFQTMERKLFYGIMTPGGTLTVLFGLWLALANGFGLYMVQFWFQVKLVLVLILLAFHIYCGILLQRFTQRKNIHGHVFYRWLNEFPVLILVSVVLLAVLKPYQS